MDAVYEPHQARNTYINEALTAEDVFPPLTHIHTLLSFLFYTPSAAGDVKEKHL